MLAGKFIVLIILLSLTAASVPAQNCICPVLDLTGSPSLIKAGEPLVFTAQVTGWKDSITYSWTVSAGTIASGQGTPSVTVDTIGIEGMLLTVTVEIRGDWCPVCGNTTASVTVPFGSDIRPVLVDKFERGNCEELLARMDNYFVDLSNNPDAVGYLLIYGSPKAVASAEREARNYIKIRRFDPARLTILRGGGTNARAEIEMWRVPPGAVPPEIAVPETPVPGDSTPVPGSLEKPFIFTSQTADGIGGCVPIFDVEGYIAALKANPKARGNIVIYEASQKAFRRAEKEILAGLTTGGIARRRLKTFFVKVKPNILAEGIELWILP